MSSAQSYIHESTAGRDCRQALALRFQDLPDSVLANEQGSQGSGIKTGARKRKSDRARAKT
ncbi:hypothetical protein D9M71_206920 [compost metagenome]